MSVVTAVAAGFDACDDAFDNDANDSAVAIARCQGFDPPRQNAKARVAHRMLKGGSRHFSGA